MHCSICMHDMCSKVNGADKLYLYFMCDSCKESMYEIENKIESVLVKYLCSTHLTYNIGTCKPFKLKLRVSDVGYAYAWSGSLSNVS